MFECVCGSVFSFADPDIEHLTSKILVATDTGASSRLKTFDLNNTTDEKKICFLSFFFLL